MGNGLFYIGLIFFVTGAVITSIGSYYAGKDAGASQTISTLAWVLFAVGITMLIVGLMMMIFDGSLALPVSATYDAEGNATYIERVQETGETVVTQEQDFTEII